VILAFCACWLALQSSHLEAFSLLGPYEAWMQPSTCFRLPFTPIDFQPGDIGGPMCISNGYRWNVPVVTYGFDQSFLNFFGTNGVAAVKGAIQILNGLPAASSVVLTNYSDDSELINYQAQAESLYDLQSVTLSLLLEQLGLASPRRFVYVLQYWTNGPDGQEFYVIMRNYDPVNTSPTAWVNGFLYDYHIWSGTLIGLNEAEVINYNDDGAAPQFSAVADNRLDLGGFYTGLTADDVGGLCYLFSTTNVHYETLLAGVSGVGTSTNLLVNGAWRPGIDKITFVPHPSGSVPWQFLPMTNQYTDTYITNGSVMQQQVQRVISQPDFLFCAGDTGQQYPVILPYARTGTSNWINNAALNGNSSGAGPGVIQPQVKITFDKLGQTLDILGSGLAETNYNESVFWGSYGQSTNAPIVYPLPQPGTTQLFFRLWFLGRSVEFSATGQNGASFLLQTSTDLSDWITISTNQINGSIFTLFEYPASVAAGFYRLVPQ
jgi:hypothetical protein